MLIHYTQIKANHPNVSMNDIRNIKFACTQKINIKFKGLYNFNVITYMLK